MINFDLEVDASGLLCPLPLLRLKKALQEIESGAIVKVIATDPAAHLDFGVYIEQTGHTLITFLKTPEQQLFFIQKK
ncbi:MAG: sulfurtransferase TusA family protein [Methylococcaceae bacterium]